MFVLPPGRVFGISAIILGFVEAATAGHLIR